MTKDKGKKEWIEERDLDRRMRNDDRERKKRQI